jgi:hypothetical protein
MAYLKEEVNVLDNEEFLELHNKKIKKTVVFREHEKLNKYYTKEHTANLCYEKLCFILKNLNLDPEKMLFIEPSAGSGVFLDFIKYNKIGFDIEPNDKVRQIIKSDFLNDDIAYYLKAFSFAQNKNNTVCLGNPPFGIKSQLAMEFVNRSFDFSNTVAFILPVQFRKWSAQAHIDKNAQLILDMDLNEDIFQIMGKTYNLRCCFQVWTKISNPMYPNLRILTKPLKKHPDFEMYQYNRTEHTKKYFDYHWDFAVPRQGYQNYEMKFYHKEECNEKYQWIFFKAKNEYILNKLKMIDFVKLSKKNIGIPGFGKADVIEEYLDVVNK